MLGSEIYLKSSSDGGGTWSAPQNITNNAGRSSNPCISIYDDHLYFLWSDNSHSIPANDSSDIFFKWSSDFGLSWSDLLNVSDNSSNSLGPRICYSVNGPLPAPWLDITIFWFDFAEGASEIFARRANHLISSVEIYNEINSFILEQNYPNPFNPKTNIGFRISEFGFVSLKVFDVLCNEVATLVNEERPAGSYEVELNVAQVSRPEMVSGVYFYQIRAGSFIETKKMVILK
jgi:hypothetical protein